MSFFFSAVRSWFWGVYSPISTDCAITIQLASAIAGFIIVIFIATARWWKSKALTCWQEFLTRSIWGKNPTIIHLFVPVSFIGLHGCISFICTKIVNVSTGFDINYAFFFSEEWLWFTQACKVVYGGRMWQMYCSCILTASGIIGWFHFRLRKFWGLGNFVRKSSLNTFFKCFQMGRIYRRLYCCLYNL